MAHLLGYEPCSHLNRALFHYPSISFSEADRRLRFTFRACSDANAGDNSNRVFVKEKKNLYGFACLPHPPLLGDFQKGISVEDRSLGGSPSKPFCFADQHLLQKLVVAVDVDEGVSLCMCSPSFCLMWYLIRLSLTILYYNFLLRIWTESLSCSSFIYF